MMSEREIMLDNAEAVLEMEERVLNAKFEGIKLKRSLLNTARELPLDECTELIGRILPYEPPTPEALDGRRTALELARDKLYEALPTGTVDAFALIKIIEEHIGVLDKILEAS